VNEKSVLLGYIFLFAGFGNYFERIVFLCTVQVVYFCGQFVRGTNYPPRWFENHSQWDLQICWWCPTILCALNGQRIKSLLGMTVAFFAT